MRMATVLVLLLAACNREVITPEQQAHREAYTLQQLCIHKGGSPVMSGDVFKQCNYRFSLHFNRNHE